MKRISAVTAILILFTACSPATTDKYERYQSEFYDVFDTYTIVLGYARDEEEFKTFADTIYREMYRLHELFDIYNDYKGINNLKTVNDNAGVAPVEVDPSVIELLLNARLAYAESGGTVNVAMGSVLRIWHDYRERGIADPDSAQLPPMDILEEAQKHTDIDSMIIDETASTVFIKDPQMSLDVGALAKGFAVQKAIEAAKKAGLKSGFISSGGNVVTAGVPMDGRISWSVGIQNPELNSDGSQQLYDTVYVSDKAVVSSGDYQRFYMVGGKAYHHIIDPETLFPADRFSAVSVIHPDSATADMLSTTLFILPYEQGLVLIQNYGADAIWISHDNTVHVTDGYKAVSKAFLTVKP